MAAILLRGQCRRFHGDNVTAASVINNQRAPNSHSASLLQRIASCAMYYDFTIEAVHIPGTQNGLADAISRLHEPGQFYRLICKLCDYYLDPFITPTLFELSEHMSHKSARFLSHQVDQWHCFYVNWMTRWYAGDLSLTLSRQKLPTEHTEKRISSFAGAHDVTLYLSPHRTSADMPRILDDHVASPPFSSI